MKSGSHHTQESKDLIRDGNLNKTLSQESKDLIGASIAKLGPRSMITRKKIRRGVILNWVKRHYEQLQKSNEI